MTTIVFPARAGMILTHVPDSAHNTSIPRESGDDPFHVQGKLK